MKDKECHIKVLTRSPINLATVLLLVISALAVSSVARTGTHRLPGGPQETLERGRFLNDINPVPGDLDQRLMPNLVEAALPAGSALVFCSSIWHTSLPNLSNLPRRVCYFGYRSSECAGMLGREPQWGAAPERVARESGNRRHSVYAFGLTLHLIIDHGAHGNRNFRR